MSSPIDIIHNYRNKPKRNPSIKNATRIVFFVIRFAIKPNGGMGAIAATVDNIIYYAYAMRALSDVVTKCKMQTATVLARYLLLPTANRVLLFSVFFLVFIVLRCLACHSDNSVFSSCRRCVFCLISMPLCAYHF